MGKFTSPRQPCSGRNISRFLQDDAKRDPTRLSAAAFGEYARREGSDTVQGRHRNRRIEILLGPLLRTEQADPTR